MEKDLVVFCRNIACLKMHYGLTNRELASIMHVGIGTVRRLLRGEVPPRVSAAIIMYLSCHFSIPPSRLFSPLSL